MNKKNVGFAIAIPIFLMIVLLMAVLAGGGSESERTSFKGSILGQLDLNEDAVPSWAVPLLLSAATTCPEITAPLLAAQIETESRWDPNAYNTGSQATGLSQFIPGTWSLEGVDGDGDGTKDPRNPADAIKSQASYMCKLVDIVKKTEGLNGEIIDLALASYNAGPGRVKQYRRIPPFPETTNYVTKIRQLANTKYANVASGTSVGGLAGAVIQKAREHVNKTTYAWGGGTLNGPSGGSSPDTGVIGFDCSSLVRYAYYQGTGQAITLPRTSREQFAATRSQPVPVEQLQPGDLLFWGIGKIHHVALYIGDGRMIEAPESGKKIRETAIRTDGDFAGAGRVFGGPLDTAKKA